MIHKIHVCGTRGSFPQTENRYMRYGTDSSCYLLDGEDAVFIDAGTGIIKAGPLVKDRKEIHILLSHLHIDHMLGLFECPFLYDREKIVHIYGETRNGSPVKEMLETIIAPPFWPLRLLDFPSDIRFHEIEEGKAFKINDIRIETKRSFHPDDALLFVIDDGKHRIGYACDYEYGKDKKKEAVKFFEGCDLLIFDGNEMPQEVREGWGHSSWEQGLAIKDKAKIETLIISHHGYDRDDMTLEEEEKKAKGCLYAKEGMVIGL